MFMLTYIVFNKGYKNNSLIAKLTLKLKKIGKTTRPCRYDLNQIPYDYTVEIRNRIKGLDPLINYFFCRVGE